MFIKYVGRDPEVWIAATGQLALKGEPLEVDDAVAKALVEQDIWEKVKTKAKDKE